jgi:hypothetical protein
MARRWNSKILLAKIETVYGTDPTPTGAADAILAQNVVLSAMEGQDLARDLDRNALGADATIPVELHQKLAFSVELAGSGAAGTAPPWGRLLRACGCAETISAGVSVTYNPVTDAHSSLTIYLWIDGTLHKLTGARGTAKIGITAQGTPKIDFEFWGFFLAPAETARSNPTLTGWQKPLAATRTNTPTFTLGGTALVMRSAMFNLGNAVAPRLLINAEEIWIESRNESFECQVEAVAVSTYNPWTLAANMTEQVLALAHGVGAGKIVTLNIPKLQLQRPGGIQNVNEAVEWQLRGAPQMTSGNDQWTLVCT